MAAQLRTNPLGAVRIIDGVIVWDDPRRHRQLILSSEALQVLAEYAEWQDANWITDLAADHTGRKLSLNETRVLGLLRAGVLISSADPVSLDVERVQRTWAAWGSNALAFHLASRTTVDSVYRQVVDANAELRTARTPPPPSAKTFGAVPNIDLSPYWNTRQAATDGADLFDCLRRRRSTRRFEERPVDLPLLGQLVSTVTSRTIERPPQFRDDVYRNTFKASPSGGSRHPVDVYLIARRVHGIDRGIYYVDWSAMKLQLVHATFTDDELVRAAGDQAWVAGAAFGLLYAASLPRQRWKYGRGRTYRVSLLDCGHLSQTVYLCCTALGLGVTFTAGLRDEMFERWCALDWCDDLVIGLSLIGWPQSGNPLEDAVGQEMTLGGDE